jgi:hypothetical protein
MSLRQFNLPPPTQPMMGPDGAMDQTWYTFMREFYRWLHAEKAVPRLPPVTDDERDGLKVGDEWVEKGIDPDEGMALYNETTLVPQDYFRSMWVPRYGLPSMTTVARDAITTWQNGDQIYNSTDTEAQIYVDGTWYELGVYPKWDDIRFQLTRDKQGNTQKPDYDYTNHGLLFPQNDPAEIVYLDKQLPHRWKLSTGVRPHVHVVQDGAWDPATGPVFKLKYRVVEPGGDYTVGWTTITSDALALTYTAGTIHQIIEFPEIDLSGITGLSAMFEGELYRDDNVVAGDVLAKEFDLHAQFDSRGSTSEYVK